MTPFYSSSTVSTNVNRLFHIFILWNIINLLRQCQSIQQMVEAAPSERKNTLGVQMLGQPESTIAPQGDEVVFECELNLEPERLEWRFRPQDTLEIKENYVYISKTASGYNVTNHEGTSKLKVYVNQKSIGEYQCIGWFGASAIASVPARLTLATISLDSNSNNNNNNSKNDRVPASMRRVLPSQSQPVKIYPGNSIIVKCGDILSYPTPVWSFYKDGALLTVPEQKQINGGIILTQMTAKDSGSYWCTATNTITGAEIKIPQKTSISIDYTPRTSPKFLYKPPNISAHPGDRAILECSGFGYPVPKLQWMRMDGKRLDNRTNIREYGLQIENVIPDDQGDYMCRLDNGIEPAVNYTMRLTVLESPKIVEPPSATLTNETGSLELECRASGSPSPDIYWMINGDYAKWDRLIRSNGTKLFIKSVEKKHAGIVQCFARNEAGEVSEANLLQVNPRQIPGELGATPLGSVPTTSKTNEHQGKSPKGKKKHRHPIMVPPSSPTVNRLSDESVMVSWTVSSNDGLPISFFKVQYRMLGDKAKKKNRSQWMTANDDIPPHVRSYELTGLKPDNFYRFRIAAVYSNNDNKLGNTSHKFHLLRASQLGYSKNHLLAPTLSRIEPILETAVVIHWQFPHHLPNPVDGFYIHYRPATSAGEYSKVTVDSSVIRHFRLDHLDPGTAYEFKLQSYTSSVASDFSSILTGKTHSPPTPPPVVPTVIAASEGHVSGSLPNYVYVGGAAGIGLITLLVGCICCVTCKKRRSRNDENESKSHPDHITVEQNGYLANGRVLQKHSRSNGISTRMNITPNPLAQDTEKMTGDHVMMSSLPPPPTSSSALDGEKRPHNLRIEGEKRLHNLRIEGEISLQNLSHRRPTTLERQNNGPVVTNRNNLMGDTKMIIDGDCGVVRNNSLSKRRPVPNSPRIMRGSNELIHHNRSPMPIRATGVKHRLGRAENMSSGSLNSIEV